MFTSIEHPSVELTVNMASGHVSATTPTGKITDVIECGKVLVCELNRITALAVK